MYVELSRDYCYFRLRKKNPEEILILVEVWSAITNVLSISQHYSEEEKKSQ